MKKIAFLPLAALLMLASCSNDDEPVRQIPDAPVQVVAPVADDVNYVAPEQLEGYTIEGANDELYRFKYSNGQEIVFTCKPATMFENERINVATVRKIEGTAADVVLPRTFTVKVDDGTTAEWKVVSVDLYTDGVTPTVKTITWPNTIYAYYTTEYKAVNSDWMRAQVSKMPGVEKIELENGFPGFASINGAIYTENLKNLVSVPRGVSGTFTIADDVQTVETRAFDHCAKIDVITFPASVTKIENDAVQFTDNLLVVNMLPLQAPVAGETAFGLAARNGVLRIPEGSLDSYIVAKPEIELPVAPVQPDAETCTDEEWDNWLVADMEYNEALAAYNEAMDAYNHTVAYSEFKTIEQKVF